MVHRRPVIKRLWFRAAAVALVAVILAIAGYWYMKSARKKEGRTAPPSSSIKQPGHYGAILTLEDGKTIELDSIRKGPLPIQHGTKLSMHKGQLRYQVIRKKNTTRAYNTITTTRGRQFRVILPDGSKVWLNAASSIIYPVAFTGNEREVYVTGETYFEVAQSQIPFKVKKGNTEVQVLGTDFNINAYDDEPEMKVTLLQGSAQVKSEAGSLPAGQAGQPSDKTSITLKPGEQVSISPAFQISQPIPVQPETVVAWKNDLFNFQDATLEQVMRQLTRWYDIEVRYEQGIPNVKLEGTISRQKKLADVLQSLERSGVHFRLEAERRLIVSK